MVVYAGDMNGHIGSSNVGYDGTHGGFGSRNADGSRILEFADGLNLVICNTLFTMQEAKLVTYVAGPVKSTVDYIINTKNCSLSLVLTATDQKPQKSLKR